MLQTDMALIVKQGNVEWSAHALEKIFERGISREAIKHIICHGEIIESYLNDKPFPSVLLLGVWDNKPLHSVIALDDNTQRIFVITAYYPDTKYFQLDFKTRRQNEDKC
jgi:hypothetical protein